MDYHAHSIDVMTIIKNGFGSETGILGSCAYTMDAINIELPKEPEIVNIGLAREHLKRGYPCIWKSKTTAEVECKQKIEEMKRVYAEIENKIKTTVEKDIGTIGNRLVGKPTLYMPESAYFQSFYYDNLIPQIYQEIILHYEGNPRKGINFSFPVLRLRDDGGKEASVVNAAAMSAIKDQISSGGKDNITTGHKQHLTISMKHMETGLQKISKKGKAIRNTEII